VKYFFNRSWYFLLPVLIWCCIPAAAQLQSTGFSDRQPGSTMVTTAPASEREVLIDVQIWGQVNRAGMYKVPVSTDVAGLISYASGPTEYAALGRVKLVRGGAPRGTVSKLNLGTFTGSGDRAHVPMLESGDVVIVPSTYSHTLAQFTVFLSQAAVVITAYLVIAGKR
jgi:hypothetical protein